MDLLRPLWCDRLQLDDLGNQQTGISVAQERNIDGVQTNSAERGQVWIVRDDGSSVAGLPSVEIFDTRTGILVPLDELQQSDLLTMTRPPGVYAFAVGRVYAFTRFSATVKKNGITVVKVNVNADYQSSNGYETTYNISLSTVESSPQFADKPVEAGAALKSPSWADRLAAVGALRSARSYPGVNAALASTSRYDSDPRVRSVAKAATSEPSR